MRHSVVMIFAILIVLTIAVPVRAISAACKYVPPINDIEIEYSTGLLKIEEKSQHVKQYYLVPARQLSENKMVIIKSTEIDNYSNIVYKNGEVAEVLSNEGVNITPYLGDSTLSKNSTYFKVYDDKRNLLYSANIFLGKYICRDIAFPIYNVKIYDKTYPIQYVVSAGDLKEIIVESQTQRMIVSIVANARGTLTIIMPRQFVNDLSGYNFNPVVRVDGVNTEYSTSSTCESVALSVVFESSSKKVELINISLPATGSVDKGFPITPSVTVKGKEFKLGVVTNAHSCNFLLIRDEKRLHIDIETPKDRKGYLLITISHELLGGNYRVLVDNKTTTNFNMKLTTIAKPDDATTISLEYDNNAKSIDIVGTTVVPEFAVGILIGSIAIGVMLTLMRLRKPAFG